MHRFTRDGVRTRSLIDSMGKYVMHTAVAKQGKYKQSCFPCYLINYSWFTSTFCCITFMFMAYRAFDPLTVRPLILLSVSYRCEQINGIDILICHAWLIIGTVLLVGWIIFIYDFWKYLLENINNIYQW